MSTQVPVHLIPLPPPCPLICSVSASQTPALQIGSPVPFSRFHIYVLIYNIWFCFPVF